MDGHLLDTLTLLLPCYILEQTSIASVPFRLFLLLPVDSSSKKNPDLLRTGLKIIWKCQFTDDSLKSGQW